MDKVFNKIDRILVSHSVFAQANNRLTQIFEASKECDEPIGVAVVGESRSGKSRLLEHIEIKHPRERREDGMYIPVLRIVTPSKPTVKGLVEIMLSAIGDPLWSRRASENEKTERLIALLDKAETSMIIIDEFQHFYDKTSNKIQHHVADWLKILVDKTCVALVVAGLPSCMSVISQNEQLSGRFTGALMMPRFDWVDPAGRNEFISVLEAFQEVLSDEFELPDLTSDNMAFRFYCASGGLVGYIAKILREAIWSALFTDRKTIDLSNLADAYDEALWKGCINRQVNPFHPKFDPTPSPATLQLAKDVGVSRNEEPQVSRRKTIDSTSPSLSEALVA